MASEYRKAAIDGCTYNDLADYGYDDNKTDLIPVDEVENVLNQIESDVKDVISLLDNITGLVEIDEVKDKLSELEMKLY